MPKLIDLTNQEFGRLTVKKRNGLDKQKRPMWLCQCSCGIQTTVRGNSLRGGNTESCGCLHIKAVISANTKHGMAETSTYKTWCLMIQRCNNSNSTSYHDYGGRGITVCDRWQNSFKAFLHDMGERPKGLTIERKNNNLGYFKANCKWATRTEQARNRRTQKRNKTGVTGITWRADCQKYRVDIKANGERYCVGHFSTIKDAKSARIAAEQKYWRTING